MVAEKFQIYSFNITGKYICESKNCICPFLLMHPSKNLPKVFIITPQAEGNYPFRLNSVFWRSIFFPAERGGGVGGGDYGDEKITKIKPTRVLVSNFDKLHHLCNLYIFG